ncbi:hypothetical protein Goarm_000394 [Gossypium armourianum]|uniref:Uncharacterized protein n=1 Tax=Gossypium armourianum TaxID=34283 RepID=A0A7J9K9S9_9ROSI|nr:hypothetical protein [Gossypium armourianum]
MHYTIKHNEIVLQCGLYSLPGIIWCTREQTKLWVRLLASSVAIV